MPAPKSDPTFIKNKDKYFMALAKQVSTGSTHPIAPGGCVIIRDREICGDGRSILADCKVELDCITYAIATACKRGTPVTGATIYLHSLSILRVCLSVVPDGHSQNHCPCS